MVKLIANSIVMSLILLLGCAAALPKNTPKKAPLTNLFIECTDIEHGSFWNLYSDPSTRTVERDGKRAVYQHQVCKEA